MEPMESEAANSTQDVFGVIVVLMIECYQTRWERSQCQSPETNS